METSPLIRYIIYELNTALNISSNINKNSDIEYLHIFRVSIRKVRSLLKLFFDDEKVLEKKLKNVVTKTNKLRELDIFLQSIKSKKYKELFLDIKKQRDNSYDEVFNESKVNTYKKLFNKTINRLSIKECFYSIEELMKKSHEHYYSVLHEFKGINPSYSAKRLHKIRIGFKKSRYALEFLQEIHICDENKKIKQCKEAQEYFGNIQDLTNQLDCLKEFCKDNKHKKECSKFIRKKQEELERLKLAI